jgi:hydrogenase maturation protease
VLVLGYGNTLRRDDGVGVRVAELLVAHPRLDPGVKDGSVIVLTAYQLTPELAVDIGSASFVIFVDADVRGLPGSIEVRELNVGGNARGDDRAEPGSSSHHVGAWELLALARELSGGTPQAVAVGIGVADLELGEGLSAPVEAALPRAVEALVRLVEGHLLG